MQQRLNSSLLDHASNDLRRQVPSPKVRKAECSHQLPECTATAVPTMQPPAVRKYWRKAQQHTTQATTASASARGKKSRIEHAPGIEGWRRWPCRRRRQRSWSARPAEGWGAQTLGRAPAASKSAGWCSPPQTGWLQNPPPAA